MGAANFQICEKFKIRFLRSDRRQKISLYFSIKHSWWAKLEFGSKIFKGEITPYLGPEAWILTFPHHAAVPICSSSPFISQFSFWDFCSLNSIKVKSPNLMKGGFDCIWNGKDTVFIKISNYYYEFKISAMSSSFSSSYSWVSFSDSYPWGFKFSIGWHILSF